MVAASETMWAHADDCHTQLHRSRCPSRRGANSKTSEFIGPNVASLAVKKRGTIIRPRRPCDSISSGRSLRLGRCQYRSLDGSRRRHPAARHMKGESLDAGVTRAKARWLKRVIYSSTATSTQKCLAYAIVDHLNCVTLDCWPAQPTLARLLGHKSIKTVRRAALGLAVLGLITLTRKASGKSVYRYAPVFRPEDMDNPVPKNGHRSSKIVDTDVKESSLKTHTKSSSTEAAAERSKVTPRPRPSFNPRERGAIEIKLAERFGAGGLDILARLASIDDAIIDRLCRAYVEGVLSERDLAAARLAAEQA